MQLGHVLDKAVRVFSFDPTNYDATTSAQTLESAVPEAGLRTETGLLVSPHIDSDTRYLLFPSVFAITAVDRYSYAVVGTDRSMPTTFKPPLIMLGSFWRPSGILSGQSVGFGLNASGPSSYSRMRPGFMPDTADGLNSSFASDIVGAGILYHGYYDSTAPGHYAHWTKSMRRPSGNMELMAGGPPAGSAIDEGQGLWTGGIYLGATSSFAIEPIVGELSMDVHLLPGARRAYSQENDLEFEAWVGTWFANTLSPMTSTGAFYVASLAVIELGSPLLEKWVAL